MTSQLIAASFDAKSNGTSVEYRVLAPSNRSESERLPLILHLHGAMSSAASLEAAKDAYDLAWANGILPRAIVACASTPTLGGFYIDGGEGRNWETLVGTEFPALLAEQFALSDMRGVIGYSLGGYAALKLAFRQPEKYRAVAALCPVIFPGETPSSVPERNRPAILNDLNIAMGADEATYQSNSVYGLARSHHASIKRSGLSIRYDCGDADEFNLHDGATYLARVLSELGIPHQFDSVRGATHVDAAMPARQARAIAFLGKVLKSAA
ncbi:alpha/beta hydrolase-fold protein [Bradyrhizobium sp. SYSU BS000235]|uniref:alpha/beta hydrolase-fold protein n=1 Tax=Bradyrhizobium sp. SYSU BS000235 TaxID=3411332 RepID=UPI003C7210B8